MSITLKISSYISFHLSRVFTFLTQVQNLDISATEEVCAQAQNILSLSLNSFLFPTIMYTKCRVIVRKVYTHFTIEGRVTNGKAIISSAI